MPPAIRRSMRMNLGGRRLTHLLALWKCGRKRRGSSSVSAVGAAGKEGQGETSRGHPRGDAMSLVRILAASLVAASSVGAAYAGTVLAQSEDTHVRSARVVAALLLALNGGGTGTVALPSRLADADRRRTEAVIREARLRSLRNAPKNANDYNIFHTVSATPVTLRSPNRPTFAAPCDGSLRFGWPCGDAPEMRAATGEWTRLSVGLHRRFWDDLPGAPLGKCVRLSACRMNQNAAAPTNVSALRIAKR